MGDFLGYVWESWGEGLGVGVKIRGLEGWGFFSFGGDWEELVVGEGIAIIIFLDTHFSIIILNRS